MLNQVILVGRLTRDPELRTTEGGKQYSFINVAVPRSFKNMNGEYETDFIECMLWEHTAKNTVTYCKKGNIVGVKGRIQSRTVEITKEEKRNILEIVAEKVTFLSPSNKEDREEIAVEN